MMRQERFDEFGHFPNLLALFFDRAGKRRDGPFLWAKRNRTWQATSWREAARQVGAAAAGLRSLGLQPGDRVLLVSENRPEWCIADLAIMAAGCVTVPAYTTNTERDHQHVLDDSGARAAIVSTARLAQPLLAAVSRSAACEHVIAIDPLPNAQSGSIGIHRWDALAGGDADIAACAATCTMGRQDLACIIYTSGTGGAPRGVMLSHGALLHNVEGAAAVIAEDFGWEDEVFLSFLPLSHAYEHTGGQFLPIGLAAQIHYSEGLEKLASNIAEVQPTIMIVVPRLFELLRQKVLGSIAKEGRLATYLLGRALALDERRRRGRTALLDWPMDRLLDRTLRRKVRARFGGRIKAMVSGGAPLNPEVGHFFQALGITLLQGYGQTESGPVMCVNRPSAGIRMETVGPPLRNTEVRIAGDGEIMCRGELVMLGYWRNEALTRQTIRDGWLATGDIGSFDEDGRLMITDRKKDLIILDKGDNVAPQRVEGMLTLQPEISQAMVVGDRRPYLVGLVVPDQEWARAWAQEHARPIAGLSDDPDFVRAISAAVDRVNAGLSIIEKVRRFILADEPFTVENRQLTPSVKIRRHVIGEIYGDRLEALYRKER
jgi:long-chain acyl-CoA synthetase